MNKFIKASNVNLYYEVVDTMQQDNRFQFNLIAINKFGTALLNKDTLLSYLSVLEAQFKLKTTNLQNALKKEDYVSNLVLDSDTESFVNTKNSLAEQTAILVFDADLDGCGTEYCWDRTIELLKKNGFKPVR